VYVTIESCVYIQTIESYVYVTIESCVYVQTIESYVYVTIESCVYVQTIESYVYVKRPLNRLVYTQPYNVHTHKCTRTVTHKPF